MDAQKPPREKIIELIRAEELRSLNSREDGMVFWPAGPCSLCGKPQDSSKVLIFFARVDLPICPDCWEKAVCELPEVIAWRERRAKRIEAENNG